MPILGAPVWVCRIVCTCHLVCLCEPYLVGLLGRAQNGHQSGFLRTGDGEEIASVIWPGSRATRIHLRGEFCFRKMLSNMA